MLRIKLTGKKIVQESIPNPVPNKICLADFGAGLASPNDIYEVNVGVAVQP